MKYTHLFWNNEDHNLCTSGLPPSSAIGLNSLLADLCTYVPENTLRGQPIRKVSFAADLVSLFPIFLCELSGLPCSGHSIGFAPPTPSFSRGSEKLDSPVPRAIHHARYLDFGCFLTDGKMLTKSRGRADRHIRNRNRGWPHPFRWFLCFSHRREKKKTRLLR